jgi:phenylacetate-CoA ligase
MLGKLVGNAVVALRLPGQARVPYLPRTELDAIRDRRIRDVVAYAARAVPYYRDWFARAGVDPRSVTGAAELDRLPVLDREQVRAEPERFVAETRAARDALSFATSGTTGTPLRVRHDRRSLLANIAYGERERVVVNRICGDRFRPTELYVGYETSTFKTVQAFYEAHTLFPRPQRRFVSLLEPLDRVAALLDAERPDVLVGYGGWIEAFFETVVARGLAVHRPKAVMSMGEALPHGTRELVEERLGVPVLSRYNAVEAFKIGFVCEARTGFHLHEDLCHVRVVGEDGRTAPPGVSGRIVLSNLVNRATVLLNYPIGDLGTMANGACPCGRTFVRLAELEGRVEDVLTATDGRLVHPRAVWQIVKREPDVLQYQLTQDGPRRFRLTLVTLDGAAFEHARARALPELIRLLGDGAIVEATRRDYVDRGAGGKFRAVSVSRG